MARLFQEDLRADPFWMLVGCQLVNRARWSRARAILEELRTRWPAPEELCQVDLTALYQVLAPLGLQEGRARNVRGFARAWTEARPETREDVLAMPGCGPYAADSWAIFVEGRRDVTPSDGRLIHYLTDGREGRAN